MVVPTIPPPDHLIRTFEQSIPAILSHRAIPGLAIALAHHGTTTGILDKVIAAFWAG